MKGAVFLLLCYILVAHAQTPQYAYTGCPNGTVWQPTPGTTWMWDLSETPSIADIDKYNVQVYDFDLFYVTVEMINRIHELQRVAVCYIDTAYEPFRPDKARWNKEDLGNDMKGWPGQKWVNTNSTNVRAIMMERLLAAKAKGCDAIEWDDVDAYKNNPGFGLSATDQANFNAYLSRITHEQNMSVGLKNDIDQIWLLEPYFDWGLNEQCYQYGECDKVEPFVESNKAVFGAEYKGSADKICKEQNSRSLSWIRTDLDLTGSMTLCCSYSSCAGVPYVCATPPSEYPYLIDPNNGASTLCISILAAVASVLLAIM